MPLPNPHVFARLAGGLVFAGLLCGCSSTVGSFITPPASAPVTPPVAVSAGPQLAYIWSDQWRTLRPVLGVPGSTQLGDSVVADGLYVAGMASNVSGLGLLQQSDGGLDLMTLPRGSPAPLGASAAPGANLRFAPSGLAAIAFSPGGRTMVVLTNLLAGPRIATITVPQPLTDAAVSDSGSLAASLSLTGSIVIRTFTPSGTPTSDAASLTTLGGMAFAGTGDDLLLADAAANTLTHLQTSSPTPSPIPLPTADLLHSPVGLAASRDGRWAALANGAEASVIRVDLTGQTGPQRFACDCQPSVLAPLSGAGVFRITSADAGPTWIFDAAAPAPRIVFIPASAPVVASKAGSY